MSMFEVVAGALDTLRPPYTAENRERILEAVVPAVEHEVAKRLWIAAQRFQARSDQIDAHVAAADTAADRAIAVRDEHLAQMAELAQSTMATLERVLEASYRFNEERDAALVAWSHRPRQPEPTEGNP